MHPRPSTWRVGEWLYCSDTGHLCSEISAAAEVSLPGQTGRPKTEVVQRLEPKVSSVFEYLLLHPGQVISRQELLDAVWADSVVVEETLTRCISLLRTALRDRSPYQYIETFPKRGYRLVASAAEFNQLPE